MRKIMMSLYLMFSIFILFGCEKVNEQDSEIAMEQITDQGIDERNQVYQYSKDFYGIYANHYETLNYLVSNSQGDNQFTANFIDGLVENDNYGNLEPALATTWQIIDHPDGTQSWIFHIAEGNFWVDRAGNKIAEIVADDWVAAAEWILTSKNGSNVVPLMISFLKGAGDYYNGVSTDFANVGVKALSKYELEYTLKEPTPYFLTALTYNVFYPVNRDYLKRSGTLFGQDSDSILYNGAYIMDQDIYNAVISFKVNPNYWEPASQNIRHVTWYYQPQNITLDFMRLKYENNEITSFSLSENDPVGWKEYVTGNCEDFICEGSVNAPVNPQVSIETVTGSSTYYMVFNFDRQNYESSLIKSADVRTASKTAIHNTNFRLGFLYGLKRELFTTSFTENNPQQWLRNTFMFEDFVFDEEHKDYMEYYYRVFSQKQGISYEEAILQTKDSQDGFYNYERAVQAFQTAKEELMDLGFTEADFPIQIETIMDLSSYRQPYIQDMIDTFNASFSGYVEIVENYPSSYIRWNEMMYQEYAYDFKMYWAGWGPDYADPNTFMSTFIIGGDLIEQLGFDGTNRQVEYDVLSHYTDLVSEASLYTSQNQLKDRYLKYAEAEYALIWEEALMIPFFAYGNGTSLVVSDFKPYVAQVASYGLAEEKFKDKIILQAALTRSERERLRQIWESEKS